MPNMRSRQFTDNDERRGCAWDLTPPSTMVVILRGIGATLPTSSETASVMGLFAERMRGKWTVAVTESYSTTQARG